MQGKRVQSHFELWNGEKGDYMSVGIEVQGEHFETWLLKCVQCGANVHVAFDQREGPTHCVEENEDGSITLQPNPPADPDNSNSLVCGNCGWHGYIYAGRWESV